MNISCKKYDRSAIARVEVLIIIGIAVIGVYLFVRYERTGEIFQISWRKSEAKKEENDVVPKDVPIPPIAFPSSVTNSTNLQINVQFTNASRPQSNPNVVIQNVGIQFNTVQKQKVLVVTNTVTNMVRLRTYPGKIPGVRIAFP